MLDIDGIIGELAAGGRVFHSEGDFQHALAWGIHEHFREPKGKDVEISLEVPVPRRAGKKARGHIDIIVAGVCAIEVKYPTRVPEVPLEGFDLRDHSAHDVVRYGFLKDLERLERLVLEGGRYTSGYVIMLTNDQHYWEEGRSRPTQDAAFRIHRGRIVGGRLEWADWREYRRELNTPITLKCEYALSWKDYDADGKFKYLAVAVPSPS